MPRYRLMVEYDGTELVGWQRQDNGPSVQAALEKAVAGLSGQTVTLFGAGRTDSGVHALGQVAHFDMDKDFPADTVRDGLNYYLRPARISVLEVDQVGTDFDARFSARQRAYLYRIINRRTPLALDLHRAWQVSVPLDAGAMNTAAQILVGEHDFTSFRAQRCQSRSPVKTLDSLQVTRHGDEIHITAEARSFLHHQVRNIVGTLKLVGEGKWSSADVRAALAARARAQGGPTAPAGGLYLVAVRYEAPVSAQH